MNQEQYEYIHERISEFETLDKDIRYNNLETVTIDLIEVRLKQLVDEIMKFGYETYETFLEQNIKKFERKTYMSIDSYASMD